jgi:hypothetical protein
MENCDDRYIDEFTIDGQGKSDKDAKKDFDERLDKKRKALMAALKCGEKTCPIQEEAPGEDTPRICLFGYTELSKRECGEKEREVTVFFRDKWKTIKVKRFECTQTFKYGCLCLEKTVQDK